ncbi:calcium/sodium antiporter [Magnetospirillum sulfuroxidans]|uniref:Calcium/sodium antiporter n=1 Tax=Magnetospirillum sulfuroxidans TaxID=611300 RepID=A0ABS5I7V1_9PROT|nr:calcium/sodium antiporter [Magnetospirillum sulfuroxidans]MBR9970490.1 calcium/sodium antiporter [Magnetospirillum sulfuroxidans]
MITDIALVFGGLLLLLFGGEALVRGAVAVARRLGLSELVIGLTLVGAMTSAPELMVSVSAALEGAPDMALGNVVGSNIANLLLVVAAGALVRPLVVSRPLLLHDGVINFVAAALLAGLAVHADIGRWQGIALLVCLLWYLWRTYVREKSTRRQSVHEKEARDLEQPALPLVPALLATIGGVAALVIGAAILVKGGTGLARAFGVSEAVIGLSLLAVGTSLPELVTSVVAAWRGHTQVALGNAIGSCIFNSLGIVGVAAMLTPLPVAPELAGRDVWVMVAVSAVVPLGMAFASRVGRGMALVFLLGYGGYMAVIFSS